MTFFTQIHFDDFDVSTKEGWHLILAPDGAMQKMIGAIAASAFRCSFAVILRAFACANARLSACVSSLALPILITFIFARHIPDELAYHANAKDTYFQLLIFDGMATISAAHASFYIGTEDIERRMMACFFMMLFHSTPRAFECLSRMLHFLGDDERFHAPPFLLKREIILLKMLIDLSHSYFNIGDKDRYYHIKELLSSTLLSSVKTANASPHTYDTNRLLPAPADLASFLLR